MSRLFSGVADDLIPRGSGIGEDGWLSDFRAAYLGAGMITVLQQNGPLHQLHAWRKAARDVLDTSP